MQIQVKTSVIVKFWTSNWNIYKRCFPSYSWTTCCFYHHLYISRSKQINKFSLIYVQVSSLQVRVRRKMLKKTFLLFVSGWYKTLSYSHRTETTKHRMTTDQFPGSGGAVLNMCLKALNVFRHVFWHHHDFASHPITLPHTWDSLRHQMCI